MSGEKTFDLVALDVPQGVVCTDGICTIPDEHPAAAAVDDSSDDSSDDEPGDSTPGQ